ncbi:MAG: flagellar export protein FliJ [Candidatus Tectomicrobia bacterium]|uniref:Flagellar FliJ protein n=1 Tax=Tectimicrobiota bacterium TaxID=2528274 RepID=A0A932GMU1_UNCTE|nr:flagellar export protein FliJ [Candidatus Tectomicrobia bacterium]
MMFKFRLEPALRVRKWTEEKLQQELAQCQIAWKAALACLAALENQKSRYRAELQDRQGRGITAAEMDLYRAYLERLGTEILHQQDTVRELELAAEAKRVELVEASKKKKVLERLKEKKQQAYVYEETRQETRILDEIAGQNRLREEGNEQRRS